MKAKSPRILIAAVIAALPLCLAPAPALANAESFTFDYIPPPFNSCTNEAIFFEGTGHEVATVSTNPDGSFHVTQHFNSQGLTGVGVISGDSYQYSEYDKTVTEFDVTSGTLTTQLVRHLEVIHQGEEPPLDDRHERVVVTTTWTDGIPTVTFEPTRFECQ